MNIPLLELLRAQPESYIWPEAVARSLDISLRRALRDLDELERFGFGIEHSPHRGIRCAGPATRLCPDQIEWQLGTRTIGRRIAVWQRVTSTNDLAARAARSASNDGLVILAEEQSAGRGRRHRRWHAPPQTSILMSVLVFPPAPVRSIALLTSLAAVAVAEVIIDSLDLPARIKWPNDVRVCGQKVCGILVEDLAPKSARGSYRDRHAGTRLEKPASRASRGTRASVIGIGVNVNTEPHQFTRELAETASSLMICCGRRLDRSDLARRLIQRLDRHYQLALRGESRSVVKRWHELADLRGCFVRVERARGHVLGRLVDVWPDADVTVELRSGERVQFPAEEVRSITEADSHPPRPRSAAHRAH